MSDNLSKLFGLQEQKAMLPEIPKEDTTLNDDADEAKHNIKTLIATGNKALEEALALAIESESPRAYEVLTNLINTLADLNSRVIDVHGKTADIKRKSGQAPDLRQPNGQPEPVNNTTNNIVFTGTTAELSKFLATLNAPKPINDGDIIDNEPKQD